MNPKQLKEFLVFAIKNRRPILIPGKPGIGKTDIVEQSALEAGAEIIVSHPVVSDPTDYKGMPFSDGKEAHFLPFGELSRLINATGPTVYFLDDLGQASASVQAACMQLLLARRINGFKISDFVTFIAATNRRQDRAGVSGLLEPVKSRFYSIVELVVNTDDWVEWALTHEMPHELISFVRFRPELLDKSEPSKEIVNTSCPRTVANVGRLQNDGVHESLYFEVFKGAAGETFATEYLAFLKTFEKIPSLNEIIKRPKETSIPESPGLLYAVSGLIGNKMDKVNTKPLMEYLVRLPIEFQFTTVKSLKARDLSLMTVPPVLSWLQENHKWLTEKGKDLE